MPWALTFSYSRAIQQPAPDIWKGQESNIAAAEEALYHRAKCNSMARQGQYTSEMEKGTQARGSGDFHQGF
jgi:fructose-bisphosphate aldolase, class I